MEKKTRSRSKRKLPTCPNCKKKYELFVVNEKFEGKTYRYLLQHSDRSCPYGIENYQHTISSCIATTNYNMSKTFTFDVTEYYGR
jgi:hypothetical protein